MKAIAKRRLLKAWQVIRQIVSFGKYAIPNPQAREVLTRVEGVADALDPNEKALRDEYGVPPDIR